MNIQGLMFYEYGEYKLNLSIDGAEKAAVPLLVTKPLPPPQIK
jgi:hypothetical protein